MKFLAGIFIQLLVLGICAAEKPNVILIMADDVGMEAFSCYGSLDYQTPNIDKIGKNGVLFKHCYAQALCTPSRNQIMTGRYNHRNYPGFGKLDKNEITFGKMMQDAGYVTAICGKWQLGRNRELINHFGFDEYLLWWLENKSERYNNVGELIGNGELLPGDQGEYGPDLMANFALDFITRHKDKPFFLYYPMILVHDPMDPTPDTQDSARLGVTLKDRKKLPKEVRSKMVKDNFVDMVHYMDKIVGKIDAKLEELGIRDNTILIFTGDNGTHSMISSNTKMGEIRGAKATLKDAGTHVPLVVSWPSQGVKGLVTDQLIDFSDFFVTLAEAGGGKMPSDRKMDGVSFLPTLQGKKSEQRKWVYSAYFNKFTLLRQDFIRTQRYKLYNDGSFYDIPNDRQEKNPISNPQGEALKVKNFLEAEMKIVSQTTRVIPKALYQGKKPKKKKSKNKI
ncbi:arylsulphatase A [Lentisphaera araneosa HTCC2155]|uniref:Arylsulphatase A n=1 Tax=Lentisphaera araneosa HTCC2155 TaxID=313628 RepID=A6DPC9_9BACT|nr:sulfatase-like hydrolase/transferase [Lentisphaera araneosa]EDM26425.1 arylsulphatase A [Lentisphaera araneosa HTCC2155]